MLFVLLFFCGAIAWFISTVAAGGAATLLMPVLAFLVGAHAVAPTITLAAIIASPSRVLIFNRHINWQVAGWLLPGTLLGALAGSYSFILIATEALEVLVGLFLMSTVLQHRFGKKTQAFRINQVYWLLPVGFGVSFVSGLIGAAGPLLNPFLLNFGLVKAELIGTKSVNSLVMQLTKMVGYMGFGAMSLQIGMYGVAVGLGAALGVYLAKDYLEKISTERFMQYVLVLMFVSGLLLVLKGLA